LEVGLPKKLFLHIIIDMRREKFANGEFYHVYNRGVDKRNIFQDKKDMERFFISMSEFNTIESIGSIYEKNYKPKKENFGSRTSKISKIPSKNKGKLVNFICYCLNPNHFHFILEQVSDNGIEKFMQRMGGYTKYFNEKYGRSGVLFQGKYKSIHVNSNEYLLHLSSYVNLNFKVHKIGSPTSKIKSSWDEYIATESKSVFCRKDIILEQFRTKAEYKTFAEGSLEDILRRREEDKDINALLLE